MYERKYLRKILERFLNNYQKMDAFVLYNGKNIQNISFRKFGEDILKTAGYFRKNKIAGVHIAMAAENSYEWFVTFFAVLVSGNVAVLINQNLTKEEILKQYDFADVQFVFNGHCIYEVSDGMNIGHLMKYSELSESQMLKLEDVNCPDEDELECLLFTSGTVGFNKAVMLSAGNIQLCMSDALSIFNVKKNFLILPLYHISGLAGTLYILTGGRTVCIGRGIKYLFQDLPVLNPDFLGMVPGIMDSLFKVLKNCPEPEKREKYLGTNLKYLAAGGAASSEKVCEFFLKEGFRLGSVYGLSETAGSGMMGILTESKLKSIGRPMEGIECRIVDGEILLSGRAVMLGYYKDPEATEKAIQNGWLHTGDLGYQDEDGWYYLTGRKKNVIILSNGENVSPEQLEELLYRCEYILECMVYSVPKGICADVYTLEQSAAASYIREYNRSVPTYHQIFRVNYYNTPLEKTGSGKIKRKENQYE